MDTDPKEIPIEEALPSEERIRQVAREYIGQAGVVIVMESQQRAPRTSQYMISDQELEAQDNLSKTIYELGIMVTDESERMRDRILAIYILIGQEGTSGPNDTQIDLFWARYGMTKPEALAWFIRYNPEYFRDGQRVSQEMIKILSRIRSLHALKDIGVVKPRGVV